MTNSTPTKAMLAEELALLTEQVTQLTEALEAAQRVQLRQTLWLQGEQPRRSGHTQGGDPWCAFSAQYASRKEGQPRIYGAYRDYVAYGEQAEAVLAAYAGGDHLVALEAYERPCAPRGEDKRRFSDFVVTAFAPVPRTEPTGEAPYADAEPTDEEVPF